MSTEVVSTSSPSFVFFSNNAAQGVQTAPLSTFIDFAARFEFPAESDSPGETPATMVIAPGSQEDVIGIADVFTNVLAGKFANRFFRVFFVISNFNDFDFSVFNPVIRAFVDEGGRFDFAFAQSFDGPFYGFDSGNFTF